MPTLSSLVGPHFVITTIFGATHKWRQSWHYDNSQFSVHGNSLHWRHNDHNGVSNHQPGECLLNRLLRRRSKKTSKFRVTGLCAVNSPGPVKSPHKGPVTRKMFPFDDVIMSQCISYRLMILYMISRLVCATCDIFIAGPFAFRIFATLWKGSSLCIPGEMWWWSIVKTTVKRIYRPLLVI